MTDQPVAVDYQPALDTAEPNDSINDLGQLNLTTLRAKQLSQDMEDIRQAAAVTRERLREQLAELDQWETDQLLPHQREFEYLQQLAGEYLRREIEAGYKKKSIVASHGTVEQVRPSRPVVRDDAALLAWAKQAAADKFVRVKEEPDWASIKKECQVRGDRFVWEGGEIVDGATLGDEQPPTYRLKLV